MKRTNTTALASELTKKQKNETPKEIQEVPPQFTKKDRFLIYLESLMHVKRFELELLDHFDEDDLKLPKFGSLEDYKSSVLVELQSIKEQLSSRLDEIPKIFCIPEIVLLVVEFVGPALLDPVEYVFLKYINKTFSTMVPSSLKELNISSRSLTYYLQYKSLNCGETIYKDVTCGVFAYDVDDLKTLQIEDAVLREWNRKGSSNPIFNPLCSLETLIITDPCYITTEGHVEEKGFLVNFLTKHKINPNVRIKLEDVFQRVGQLIDYPRESVYDFSCMGLNTHNYRIRDSFVEVELLDAAKEEITTYFEKNLIKV
jgi:hypothetical protein